MNQQTSKKVAPFVQHGKPRITCDQAGICLCTAKPCAGCTWRADMMRPLLDDCDPTPTPFDRMPYWASVGVVAFASVCLTFGAAGYIWARWL